MVIMAQKIGFAQTVSGTITDLQSGEVLPYITVYNRTTKKGTTTDLRGVFNLEATESADTLKINGLGYVPQYIIASNNIHVQLELSTLDINEIIVTVNREQESRTEAPLAISSISNLTIEDNKPTSIDQVLNQTAGVNMVSLGNEQHTMSIRRPIDYGASYLYLEDGVPIRTSGVFNHNALLEINMANTNRIEIIRGPASSFYGSEAIGGAINFISKKPSLLPSAGVSIQGNNIGYRRTDFYASSTIKKKLGIRFSGYYANQRDGIISHSDFDKLAMSLSANYFVSRKTELIWSSTFVDYYADMSGSIDSADFYDGLYESDQTFTNRQVDAFRTKVALNHYWNNASKSSLTGYFRKNSVRQNPSYRVKDDFKPWIPGGDPNLAHGELNDNRFKSVGMIAQHRQNFNWMKSQIIGGASLDFSPNTYQASYIEIHKTDEGVYDSFEETDSLLADYTANLVNLAMYVQGKIELLKNLNVIGALRYDHFQYDFDNYLGVTAFTAIIDGQDVFRRFTPKVGMTYDLKKNRGVYANYSQGFVPPQVTELYRGNEAPTLKPVFYSSYELGGWASFAKNKGKIELSAYNMDGVDEIISVLKDDGSTERQNAGQTSHRGIEYAIHYSPINDLNFRFSGTNAIHEFIDFNESGNDYSGNLMPQAPNWIANAQITYKPAFIKGLRTSVEWQHIDEYFMNQDNSKSYKGYDIINVRVGYNWKAFEVWVNALNVSNELYSTVARANKWGQSYSLGKPRNFNIGLAYNFKSKKK
jgi:outer membrane receptor protein involved in Fe transport